MNEKKLPEISKSLISLHVKDILKKNKGLNLRTLSETEKKEIKKVIEDLQERVDEFVKQASEKKEKEE
ncbi:hypothetical protein ACFYKX_09340 [Cytobacillus sp. FJAT-54145]|uniref:Spore coat protein W n=1 Tax=Cytobacillus spartinae TaxID=3299023 RepID=A0ABW6KDQ0_9BACI